MTDQSPHIPLDSLLEAALRYVREGLPVFPVKHNKKPWTEHGFKDASTDAQQIRLWWREHPDAGVAMPTGTASGRIVVDIDPRNGGDKSLAILEEEHGALPATLESHTGGGGRHLFFVCRGRSFQKCELARGIDIQGEGAYVVLPPSFHSSGHRYGWVNGNAIAELPLWLEELLLAHKSSSPAGTSDGARIPEGHRNNTLTSLAGSMRRRGMSVEAIRVALWTENISRCQPPLSRADVDRIANSVGRYPPAEPKPATEQESSGPSATENVAGDNDGKLQIIVRAGGVPDSADRAEDELLAHPELRLFQRAGEVVRLGVLPDSSEDARLRRPAGTVVIQAMTLFGLLEVFDRLADWIRYDTDGEPYSVDCPQRVGKYYLARGSWRLPVLRGTVFSPLLRDDGTILSSPGFDAATGLYMVLHGDWPALPEEPSKENAQQALQRLLHPFREFPFCGPVDLAAHVAAILTAIQRRMLRAALFGYDAPVQRTGKSLLAESLGLIANGRKPPATVASSEHEEFRKAITAALYEGHPIVNFDNLEKPLASPALALAITQEIYADRILGATRELHLPTRVLWTATGNNLTFRGDLAVRTLVCRIDSGRERPEQRRFEIEDLPAYLLEHRKELVCAALTILRAYRVAGRPGQGLPPLGGFEQWSGDIREAMVWVGMEDPVACRDQVIADDPERTSATAVLHAIWDIFQGQACTIRVILEAAKLPGNEGLLEALVAVAGRKTEIDTRALGWWLRKHKDRVIDCLRLSSAGNEDHYVRWKVEKVGS
jgi:hypothetical protein